MAERKGDQREKKRNQWKKKIKVCILALSCKYYFCDYAIFSTKEFLEYDKIQSSLHSCIFTYINSHNKKKWGGRSGSSIVGRSGGHTHVVIVLRECMLECACGLIVLPPFDDTSSLDYPTHRMVYPCSLQSG